MKEFGWTFTELLHEAREHPDHMAQMEVFMREKSEREHRDVQRSSGNYRMGEKLHGTPKSKAQWRDHYTAESKATELGVVNDLEKKFGKHYVSG